MVTIGGAFTKRLNAISSSEDLCVVLERALRPFGLTQFAIASLLVPDRESLIYLTNWPST